MSVLLKGVAAIVVLLGAAFVWGYVRLRNREADVRRLIATVTEHEVPALVDECVRVFRDKLRKELALGDLLTSARVLDDAMLMENQQTTIAAFERAGHPGWYVKPMGACLGELLRKNARASWKPAEGGGLAMVIG